MGLRVYEDSGTKWTDVETVVAGILGFEIGDV